MSAGGKVHYMKQSGKLWDKNCPPTADGLVATMTNYHIKNHLWRIERLAVHRGSGDVASSDERGQVYVYSTDNNTYSSVRLASTAVSALEFIHSRQNRLIVAYVHGVIAVLDTESKTVVGHLQLSKPAVITKIRCHATKPIALMVSDDGFVSMWDLRTLLCTRTLRCQEPLIDIEYTRGGSLIALAYQNTGVVYYQLTDGAPELKLIRFSERQPRWVSHCSTVKRDRVILSGDNGMLYIFDGTRGVGMSAVQFADKLLYEDDKTHVKGLCPLLSVAEVPVQLGNVVCMAPIQRASETALTHLDEFHTVACTSTTEGLNVAMLTSKGNVLLVNISERTSTRSRDSSGVLSSSWTWRVIMNIPPSIEASGKVSELSALYSTLTPSISTHSKVAVMEKDALGSIRSSEVLTGGDRLVCVSNVSYKWGAGSHFAHHISGDTTFNGAEAFAMGFVTCDDGKMRIYDWGDILSRDAGNRLHGEVSGLLWRSRQCGESTLGMVAETRGPSPSILEGSPAGGKTKKQSSVAASDWRKVAKKPVRPQDNVSGSNDENAWSNSMSPSKLTSSPTAEKAMKKSFKGPDVQTKRPETRPQPQHHAKEAAPALSASIYDLSSSLPKGSKMSKAKLLYFLEKNGRYPDEYRPLIWRYLLQLPENELAFAELVKRGNHTAFAGKAFARRYPLDSSRLFTKLQSICSQLAHWSVIFGEAPYIPQLCFPFLLIFENDELAALETVMTLLMWWGYSWHVCHPNPPVQLTDSFDAVLQHHDPTLHKHLRSIDVSPGLIGWRLTYTVYSEFVSKEAWLRLMDYIFTHFDTLELMVLLPVAMMRLSAPSLMCVHAGHHVVTYFNSQQDVKVSSLTNMVMHMLETTPKALLLACRRGAKSRAHDTFKSITEKASSPTNKSNKHKGKSSRSGALPGAKSRMAKPHTTISQRGGIDEEEVLSWRASPVEAVRQSLAAEAGSPIFPLPRERYPAYDGYPKAMVDWELRKRSVQMALDEEMECREDVLHELEKRIEQLDSDHDSWMANHKAATDNEIKSRYELMQKEKEHMRQLALMEEMISRKRLSALTSLEKAAQEELAVLDEAALETKKMLDAGEEHLRGKMEAALNIQRHREMGESTEAVMNDRLHKLYIDRARDERMKALSDTLQRAEADIEVTTARMSSELQHLEEVARAKRSERLRRSKEIAEEETTNRLRSGMLDRLAKLSVDREDKMISMERQATLKELREQAREAEETIRRIQLVYERQEADVVREAAGKLATEALFSSKKKLEEVLSEIRKQSEELLEQERVAVLKESMGKVRSRGADIAIKQSESLQAHLQESLSNQIEAQNELLRLRSAAIVGARDSQVLGQLASADSYLTSATEWQVERRPGKNSATASAAGRKESMGEAIFDEDASSGSSSKGNIIKSSSPRKRRFAAVDALLGGGEEPLEEVVRVRPHQRSSYGDDNDSSMELPSKSILSPSTDENRHTGSTSSAQKRAVTYRLREAANKNWSDESDIQFPASSRLKKRQDSNSSSSGETAEGDDAEYGRKLTSSTRFVSTHKETTTQKTMSEQHLSSSRGPAVSDVTESRWAGFSYRPGEDSDDSDGGMMKKLAEKNLDVLGVIRNEQRVTGSHVLDRDVQELLRRQVAHMGEEEVSTGHKNEVRPDGALGEDEASISYSSELPSGEDDDSALWNHNKPTV